MDQLSVVSKPLGRPGWVRSVLESIHHSPGERTFPGRGHDQSFRELLESFHVVAFIDFPTGTFHAELLFDRQGNLRSRHGNHASGSGESGEYNTSAVAAAPEEKPKIGRTCDPPADRDGRREASELTGQQPGEGFGGVQGKSVNLC